MAAVEVAEEEVGNMRLAVKVKTGAKKNEVKKIDNSTYTIFTTAQPIEGKANKAVIDLLADFLDISPSRINIVSGLKSKQKIVEIY